MAKEKTPKAPKEKKIPKNKAIRQGGFDIGFFVTPPVIFFEYLIACAALTLGFRFLFPVSRPPLALYSSNWRFTEWILEFTGFFPALAMSGLMIPFGRRIEEFGGGKRFSGDFLLRLKLPILTAIMAAIIYGALFFLVRPLAGEAREKMVFRGELYADSRDKAIAHAKMEEWTEAFRFATICGQIWPNNPDVSELTNNIDAEFYRSQYLQDRDVPAGPPPESDLRKRTPVDAAEALRFGETALAEERYYDAHWLATLAGRLAEPNSIEAIESLRLAGRAWNAIESLAPNSREQEQRRIYQLKRSGYEAMVEQDWIKGYYIFKELIGFSPDDPDAVDFLRRCETETLRIAFFADELELTLGDVLTEAVFSLPRYNSAGEADGRLVLRVGALSTFSDYSYGFDIDLVAVDSAGSLSNRMEAPYAKFLPKAINGKQLVVLLLQSLDRRNPDLRWGPVWTGPGQVEMGGVELLLHLSYEDFLLITQVRRGLEHFQIPSLFAAEQNLAPYGYIRELFRAQAITRIAEPLFFLPLFILALVVAWRFRPQRQPRYLAIPMLVIMPAVFLAFTAVYRSLINALGIALAFTLSFTASMVVLGIAVSLFFSLSLIILVFQRA
ncbi:MAG: hypothetical protein LBF77_01695 [Spirochaetaceae bacterium]|jgi:hypothetical protein|nr:hypothetical protein [Spirochaetaceae bacterium]